MPITRKATEAATKKRVHGKHVRWAEEMRRAGWWVIDPIPDATWLQACAAELREAGWEVTAPEEIHAQAPYSFTEQLQSERRNAQES